MARIQPVNPEHADNTTRATLNAVKSKLGILPNLISTLAHSPVALNAYLSLSEQLGKGRLTARQREIIALAVAQTNECHYCLSAHTAIGKGAGLSDNDIQQARNASATNSLDRHIAQFAQTLVKNRGVVSDAEFAGVQAADIDAGLALEILLNVIVNLLTNYTNHVAATDIDFPVVDLNPDVRKAS